MKKILIKTSTQAPSIISNTSISSNTVTSSNESPTPVDTPNLIMTESYSNKHYCKQKSLTSNHNINPTYHNINPIINTASIQEQPLPNHSNEDSAK